MRTILKYVKIFFTIDFLFVGIFGITQYIKTSEVNNLAASTFCIIISVFLFMSIFRKKNESQEAKKLNTQYPDVATTNPAEDIYFRKKGTVSRIEGREISDEEVPYLIQSGLETAIKAEKESPNPKFHRTDCEEELSFQFMMKYGGQVQVMTDAFEESYRAAYDVDDYQEKIRLYEKALTLYYKAQKFCYSKGKGGTIYFQDLWEYMHNSQDTCFSYEILIKNAIDETKETYEVLIPSILKVISENQGILQKDIYKFLPEFDKARIRRLIKQLNISGEVIMEKKGNSYILTST